MAASIFGGVNVRADAGGNEPGKILVVKRS